MSEKLNFPELDNLFEPTLVCNDKGEVLYTNNTLVTFLKRPPRVIRKAGSVKDIFPDNTIDFNKYLEKSVTEKGTVLSEELNVQIDGTPYTVVLKISPFEHDNKILYVGSLNDLSVEKNLYDKYREQLEELKTTHAQIVQEDKLRTIGELTAGISHEINNPLTVAAGNTEIIGFTLEEEDLNKERDSLREAMDNIKDSHQRIEKIIVNMKDFLYKNEDKKEYCQMDEIITRVLDLVKSSYSESEVGIDVAIRKDNIVGLVNRLKIEQVLVNLMQNALDSITEAGVEKGNVQIILDHDPDAGYVTLDVIDNGPGVSGKIRDEIFNTFFTTKDTGKGTGLGLSISSRIMQSHQGRLELCESKNGAHFRISLPVIEVSSYADNEQIFSNVSNSQDKKVLIVDNEVHILNLCNKFLEEEPYIFIGSTGGPDALNVLDKIPVDLIITDYKMPEMNGSQFAKAVREMGIDVPILYMTSKDKVGEFQKDKESLGIRGMIVKPFTKDELLKTILHSFEDK